MDKELLVRFYRVGFGDCIYIQIPDDGELFTILVDCGTSADASTTLKPAVQHICSHLPKDQNNKPRLDLLVVTHPHADHIKGFDPEWFKGVTIGRIWMTAFMDQQHPQAKKALAFEKAAYEAAKSLQARSGLVMGPGAQALLLRSLSLANTGALSALRQDLLTIEPRLYVARDVARHLTKKERKRHKLSFKNGVTCFQGFRDKHTCIRVLAPEWNIDGTYLGQTTAKDRASLDPLLIHTKAYGSASTDVDITTPGNETVTQVLPNPSNISDRDFRLLRGNLLYSALAFSQEDDDLKNNVSVVFLLEWCGKRLLFTGDAEWEGTGVQKGQRNSSWDVMLDHQDVKDILLKPLDLFKVAHHGSHNGTPFGQQEAEQVLSRIATPDRTNIVISTVVGVHGKKNPVPYAPLLTDLGRKAVNQRIYPECEPELKGIAQPQRTDLESDATEPGVDYLEVMLKPT